MKRAERALKHDIFEDLVRIEETSNLISNFFSKIWDIEKDLGKNSKYAWISRNALFLAIQRSKSMAADILRKIDVMHQNGIKRTEKLEELALELKNSIMPLEIMYNDDKFDGMVKKLNEVGKIASKILEREKLCR
jgi:hypothetical protein